MKGVPLQPQNVTNTFKVRSSSCPACCPTSRHGCLPRPALPTPPPPRPARFPCPPHPHPAAPEPCAPPAPLPRPAPPPLPRTAPVPSLQPTTLLPTLSLPQDWVNLPPKNARHIFITDRMSRACPGPANEPAAWSMGNSLYQWLRTYFPTFKLEQMKQSQLQMEPYRLETLRQQGVAAADPRVALMGEAPAVPLVVAVPAEPGAMGMQLQQLQQQQQQFQEHVVAQLQQIEAAVAPAGGGAAAAVPAAPAGPAAALQRRCSSDSMLTAHSGGSLMTGLDFDI